MPAKSDEQRAKIAQQFVEVAIDDAHEIQEELYGDNGLYERRRANREQLRSLRDQGYLSDEQEATLLELYPPRQKGEDEDDDEATEPQAA